MSAVLLSLLIAAIGLIFYWVQKQFRYWNDHGFEYLKPVVFPFGNLKGVGYKVHLSQIITEAYKNYKNKSPVLGLYFYTSPVAYILDLDVIKHVMIKDFNNFHSRGLYYNTKIDPLSGHIFALQGNEWKNMRAKLTPTFTSRKMKMMFNTVLDISGQMIEYIEKSIKQSPDLEMKEILSQFTTDVIGNVAFGLQLNSMEDPNSQFRKYGRKVFNPPWYSSLKVLFLTCFPNLSKKLNLMITDVEVSNFFLGSIQETVEYREKNNIMRNDFLNLLIQIKNHGKIDDDKGEAIGKLTMGELAAQSYLFFLAGFETSSTTMMFCLYELAQNQDVQERLRQEIKTSLENTGGKLTYESMVEMKYLQIVIDETLRIFPPVDTLMRQTAENYTVPGTKLVIPKDMLVFIPIRAIQTDPEIYSDPEKFDPERFNEENKRERHPMAHIPFGDGNRNCLGVSNSYCLINSFQN
jgi:cytochrome P450 family 6